ncbi:MAG: hypothetical protein HZA89_05875, partial [Verrucomicrobia bacterium]|nr:hypothetical protein [Verrucomicrobiota bacterium]
EAVQQARFALQFMAGELREASTVPGAIIVWSTDEGAAQDGLGFLTGRAKPPPDAHYFQAAQIALASDAEVPFEMEGDLAGELPASISVKPLGLRLVVP